jgi:plastocyanin
VRRSRALLVLLLVASVALAGCIDPPSSPSDETAGWDGGDVNATAPEAPWVDANGMAEEVSDADVTVDGTEWSLAPYEVRVAAGEPATVALQNVGDVAPTWALDADGDGEADDRTPTIQPGEAATVTVPVPEAGDDTFFCDVSGHQEADMEGTPTVSAG